MKLKNVTLELSSKPFVDDSEETMRSVCRRLFKQWERLWLRADGISVLLWISDGSEILEYDGDPESRFEWAYWQGIANHKPRPEHPNRAELLSFNYYPAKYREDAAPRPYKWLKRLIEVIKEEGYNASGKAVRVGATFDNGPEFAVSDFKYRRHREIAQAHSIYPHSFVTCDSTLHADPKPYAAFPNGIPEGISLGEFLGRQFKVFAKDMGYDYVWLSNGMGFGTETWGITGALFDNARFYPERIEASAERMLGFWRDFTKANPGLVIETRGSNHSAGVEISTDAAPLKWLYSEKIIVPPVNSPSAGAIYGETGLELAGWMSHIAELPGDIMPFRYYIHDPWFLNSPWLDRYGRQPWDLYLPLSVSRVKADGSLQTANSVAILTCDDSWGAMPDQVPEEMLPALFECLDKAPDQPGPLLWIYPFDEYSESKDLELTFNEDTFLGNAIQGGAPVNTVISAGNFRALAKANPDFFKSLILVVPISATRAKDNLDALLSLVSSGVGALLYGSLNKAPAALVEALGLELASPLQGRCEIETALPLDEVEKGSFLKTVNILPQFDGGPLVEAEGSARVLACVKQGAERRVLCSVKRHGAGRIVFLRGHSPVPSEFLDMKPSQFPTRKVLRSDASKVFPTDRLMRWALSEFGWTMRVKAQAAAQFPPHLCVSRHDGEFIFSGYAPDTSVELALATPLGVPVPVEREISLRDGLGRLHLEKSPRLACRCFARQAAEGVLSAKTYFPFSPGFKGRQEIRGLKDAELRFFVPPGSTRVEIRWKADGDTALYSHDFLDEEWIETPYGKCLFLKNVSGLVIFAWG